ncbi:MULTISPECIES: endopeptidase La [unclassified Algoriphagus]|jgi:ATP-dependent Lon protease|uniref:endopeptidase La n=6 Tax=Algoriphagus TaxID=246875 RepID=UPI000C4C511A|nr:MULTISPECIES: endopeptidase La [unclassified Algoriphagus]MAL13823.1 endopeptidase La [Algoriphagus sp.]HAD51695.1 endopeptidase La [Algoriphagus sp.]HCH43282.1 endopeptidase La [Algoriphagus sp.]
MSQFENSLFDNLMVGEYAGEGDLIQLITDEEDDQNGKEILKEEIPILSVRNTVLFPGVVIPITVGRQRSIKLVKKAQKGDKMIGVCAQINPNNDDPAWEDIYQVGTLAKIIKMIVLPDGNTTIIIQGKKRFKIREQVTDDPYFIAKVDFLDENFPKSSKKIQALEESLKDAATRILHLNPEIPREAQVALDNIDNTPFLTHFLSSNINAPVESKQRLLEINDGVERATLLLEFMMKDIQMLELKSEIQKKVHTDIDQQQRDYFLRQQMKVLQTELGEEGPEKEVEDLRVRGAKKNWPAEVAKHFEKELDKILRINPSAAEYPIALNYAETMVELPWNEFTQDNFDLKHAKEILDADHFGLEKVKERIIEYLAVLKLKNDLKGPILCLYGPPGVGKTSLGKSIAAALGRKYIRMSLGGLHDEAEIRGHRKTYVGAMPGKIIQNMKKVKISNPVFVLDEIDKLSSDFRGDPSSAFLEVLDPEQNFAFLDNYLEVEYDLSKVLFIATANSLDTIQPALRDRMEIIEVTGYTQEEKVEIAKRHLVPKQRKEHGLKANQIRFDKSALVKIIEDYTRESGVRNLERAIGKVVRNVAKSIAMEEEYEPKINAEAVRKILGSEMFDKETYQDNSVAGVVTGLAWTSVGGEILFIESSLSRGKGKLTLSGQLGDVMKESAMTALSYLKSQAEHLEIDHRVFDQYDLHIHVPAGAVPKDGPSAGITMLTAMASVYTQRRVKAKVAMTGEISLIGKVMPVGGIKEKILAAKRAGIKEIILCKKNKRDIEEIDEQYIKGIDFHFVDKVSEVLDIALLKSKVEKPLRFSFQSEAKTAE